MKKTAKEEIILLNVERNPLLLMTLSIVTAGLSWFAWTLLRDINPWGFIAAIPAGILLFQMLWLFLNPFAEIYEDRVDIRKSFAQRSTHYFTDIKKITVKKGPAFYFTYHDDDIEKLSLKGIRNADVEPMRQLMEKQIAGLAQSAEVL